MPKKGSLMKNFAIVVFLSMLTAICGSLSTFAQPTPTIVNQREVALPVLVLDAEGNGVPGLAREQFSIFIDKVPQQITGFSQNDTPCSIVILLDISASMRGNLKDIQEHLKEFLQESNPTNEYLLITFGETSQIIVDWTKDTGRILSGANGLNLKNLDQKTKLFDACFLASEKLKERSSQKRIVLLITDAQDDRSKHGFEEILQLYRQNQITALCVNVSAYTFDLSTAMIQRQAQIGDLSAATGGRAFFVINSSGAMDTTRKARNEPTYLSMLSDSFKRAAVYPRLQYLVVFTPLGIKSNTASHKIQVKISSLGNPTKEMKNLRVRHREWFYTEEK
jgi:VWFA-related protein